MISDESKPDGNSALYTGALTYTGPCQKNEGMWGDGSALLHEQAHIRKGRLENNITIRCLVPGLEAALGLLERGAWPRAT